MNGLPSVFKPNEKPWIQPEGVSSEEIMTVVDRCPSGALSYYKNGDAPTNEEIKAVDETRVEVMDNGPLLVHGTLEITHADGNKEIKTRSTAFCRCGKTGNTPFCDGSHKD